MRLVIIISIFILFILVLSGVACTNKPIFTEDEVTELIRHWEQGQLLRAADQDKVKVSELRDRMCWHSQTRYWNECEPYIIRNPLVTANYSFKSNRMWLVNVITIWDIPEEHRDTASVAYGWVTDKTDVVDGNMKRKCLYRVNDETGEVKPAGID